MSGRSCCGVKSSQKISGAIEDLNVLVADLPDQPQTWTAVLKSGEAALEQNVPDEAVAFFQLASTCEKILKLKRRV
jgi:hypothetical protein